MTTVIPPPGASEASNGWEEVVLTDASWLSADPAGLVSSVARSGDYNLWTENTLAASADLQNEGTNFTGWRAYKALVDTQGNPVTSDDIFALESIVLFDPPATRSQAIVECGLCVDPTSTVYATIQAMRGGMYQPSGGNLQATYREPGGGGIISGVPDSAFVTAKLACRQYCSINTVGYQRPYTLSARGNRNSSSLLGTATPLFVWVGYSKRFATDAGVAGAQLKARIFYRKPDPTPSY